MNPKVPINTNSPAIITPIEIEKILFFLSNPSNQETKQPLQAPVKGKGTATNKTNARNPKDSCFFSNLSTFF